MGIQALHALVYSDDADATREFFRDVLEWPHVDVGGGWLIFKSGPSELGVHPTDPEGRGAPAGTQGISLMCDDVAATRADLEARGIEFTSDIVDEGFGLTAWFTVPGNAGTMMLYEPRHELVYELPD